MSQITPFVKRMRTQGGTLYTFSSAVEDIGLNINERTNEVEMSHFALLQIPEITSPQTLDQNKFNVLGITGALDTYEKSDSIKDGRIVVAESFQNYALNLETNLLANANYNPTLLHSISERVFWKWLKETGAVRWVKDNTNPGYFKEEIDSDSSLGYNSVVKYIGQISAGSVRTDAYGTYNETFVLVPTSHGQTDVWFKQTYDDNYTPKMVMGPSGENIYGREGYTQPHPDGLSLLAQYDVATDTSTDITDWTLEVSAGSGYVPGSWWSAQGNVLPDDYYYITDVSSLSSDSSTLNYDIKYSGAGTVNFKRSNVDALGVELGLDKLKELTGDDTLTYDKLAIQDSVDDTFDFNAVLLYYKVWNPTMDKLLATNLLGILFLDPAVGSTAGFPSMEIEIPAITKLQSTGGGFGSSYSFRVNIKSDNMIDDTQAVIVDESTSDQVMVETWGAVFDKLSKSLSILNSHTGTINYITEQYMQISSIQTQQATTLADLQYQVNDVVTDIKGTNNTIAMFQDGDDPIVDSSIYMRFGKIGIFTNNPQYGVHIDSSVKVMDITIENAVRDTSGNILLGYGSPLQLGSSTNYRQIDMYVGGGTPVITIDTSNNVEISGNTTVDGSLSVSGDTTISGSITIDGSLTLGGGSSLSGYVLDGSIGVPGTGLEWIGGLVFVDASTGGVTNLWQLGDVSIGDFDEAIPYGSVLTWDVDISMWTYQESGGGDVTWANDTVGPATQILTGADDGSIQANSGLVYANSVLNVDGSLLVANLGVNNANITIDLSVGNNLDVGNDITSSSLATQNIDASTILTQALKVNDVSLLNDLTFVPGTGTPSGLSLPYLFVDDLDGNKVKRTGGTGLTDASAVTYSPGSEVYPRMLIAGGGNTVFGTPHLTFDGSIMEFNDDTDKHIRMQGDPDSDAHNFFIKGADATGQFASTTSYTTLTPYTYHYTTPTTMFSVVTTHPTTTTVINVGQQGFMGGDLAIEAGSGGNASGGSDFNRGGVGGDLLLNAGPGGTGGTPGAKGVVLVDGAVITLDSDYVDIPYRLRHLGNTLMYQEFNTDMISWEYNNVQLLNLKRTGTDAGTVFNQDGTSTFDFRVESDAEDHMLFVDSGANKLISEDADVVKAPFTQRYITFGSAQFTPFTVFTASDVTHARYIRNLDKKLYRLRFHYTTTSMGSTSYQFDLRKGTNIIETFNLTLASADQGIIEYVFGADTASNSTIDYTITKNGASPVVGYTSSIAHGSLNGIDLLVTNNVSSTWTMYIRNLTLEVLDS